MNFCTESHSRSVEVPGVYPQDHLCCVGLVIGRPTTYKRCRRTIVNAVTGRIKVSQAEVSQGQHTTESIYKIIQKASRIEYNYQHAQMYTGYERWNGLLNYVNMSETC